MSNATLNVPSDFATIQDALVYMDDKAIKRGAVVTIQVADGTYTDYDTICVDHRDGNRIHIIGNTNAPNCNIQFTEGENGVEVRDGHQLGLIDGFVLSAPSTNCDYGIFAENCAVIKCGFALLVEGFAADVLSGFNSFVDARGVQVNNGGYGVLCKHGGAADVSYAQASNNTKGGFAAGYGACLMGDYTESYNNAWGFWSGHVSSMWIRKGIAQNNTYGLLALIGSELSYIEGVSSDNVYGAFASRHASVYLSGGVITNNTLNYNPATNIVGNNNSIITKQ